MMIRLIILFFVLGFPILQAQERSSSPLDMAGRTASASESQRITKNKISPDRKSALTEKTFPIDAWTKHFSSLGGKRAQIEMSSKDSKTVSFELISPEVKAQPTSRMNDKAARFRKTSRVQTTDSARIAEERQVFSMQLQNATLFRELGKHLSLRDINRFQFRQNRDSGSIPTQKAGAGVSK